MTLTKNDCKALIISKFVMLECGTDFKDTMNDKCATCDQVDNKEHCLNSCDKFKESNFCDDDNKIPFNLF